MRGDSLDKAQVQNLTTSLSIPRICTVCAVHAYPVEFSLSTKTTASHWRDLVLGKPGSPSYIRTAKVLALLTLLSLQYQRLDHRLFLPRPTCLGPVSFYSSFPSLAQSVGPSQQSIRRHRPNSDLQVADLAGAELAHLHCVYRSLVRLSFTSSISSSIRAILFSLSFSSFVLQRWLPKRLG